MLAQLIGWENGFATNRIDTAISGTDKGPYYCDEGTAMRGCDE
jgi:hypothetical protein